MKFILQILMIAIGGIILLEFFPFYTITIVGFLAGVLFSNRASFLAGMIGVGLTWYLVILLRAPVVPEADLAARMSQLVGSQDRNVIVWITVTIGALLGGFSTLTGSLVKPVKKRTY